MARSDLPAAERAAHAVEAADSRHPDAAHVLALVALARRLHSQAIDACDRAIAVLPDHAPFHTTPHEPSSAKLATPKRSRERAVRWPLRQTTRERGHCSAARSSRPKASRAGRALPRTARRAISPRPERLAFGARARSRERRGNVLSRQRGARPRRVAGAIRIYEEALPIVRATRCSSTTSVWRWSGPATTTPRESGTRARSARTTHRSRPMRTSRGSSSACTTSGGAASLHAYATAARMYPRTYGQGWAVPTRLGTMHAAEESYRKALERAPRDADIRYGLAALLTESAAAPKR